VAAALLTLPAAVLQLRDKGLLLLVHPCWPLRGPLGGMGGLEVMVMLPSGGCTAAGP